jgi:hypothetical protein
MLYKKYTIEVVYETKVIQNLSVSSNNTYDNQIQMNFTPMESTINTIKFVAEDGQIQDYECYFDTKKKAFDTLSTYYYSITGDINVLSVKIVPVYNDIIPPLDVLRSMKIKKILD